MIRLESKKLLELILIFCLIFQQNFVEGRTSKELKVVLPDGSPITGRYLTSDSGKGIRAFMGLPYAEPPVGDLRFQVNLLSLIFRCIYILRGNSLTHQDPVSKKPWTHELKAFHSSEICTQRDPFRRDLEVEGSEDCLYLNLYAPVNASVSGLLPVMVRM